MPVTTEEFGRMLEEIRRDMRAWTDEFDDLTVVDQINSRVLGVGALDDNRRKRLAAFPTDGLVALAGGNTWFIDDRPDEVSAIVKIVSYLQDQVMDEIGSGWPELTSEGEFVGLLAPFDAGDSVVWRGEDGTQVALGQLATLRGTRIL